jgi:hypothetical protein
MVAKLLEAVTCLLKEDDQNRPFKIAHAAKDFRYKLKNKTFNIRAVLNTGLTDRTDISPRGRGLPQMAQNRDPTLFTVNQAK